MALSIEVLSRGYDYYHRFKDLLEGGIFVMEKKEEKFNFFLSSPMNLTKGLNGYHSF